MDEAAVAVKVDSHFAVLRRSTAPQVMLQSQQDVMQLRSLCTSTPYFMEHGTNSTNNYCIRKVH